MGHLNLNRPVITKKQYLQGEFKFIRMLFFVIGFFLSIPYVYLYIINLFTR